MKATTVICLLLTFIISNQLHASETEMELKTLHAKTLIRSVKELKKWVDEYNQSDSKSMNFDDLDIEPIVIADITWPSESDGFKAIYAKALSTAKNENPQEFNGIVSSITCEMNKNMNVNPGSIERAYTFCHKADSLETRKALVKMIQEEKKATEEAKKVCPKDSPLDGGSSNWRSLFCCNQCR